MDMDWLAASAKKFYRFYTIDASGHVVGKRRIEFRTQDDAVEHARRLAPGHVVEVWDNARRIVTVGPWRRTSPPIQFGADLGQT
jgi:hypothetical protein